MESKELWADNLRAIATVAVIFLHVSAASVYEYGNISASLWWVGNVYDSSVRFCVPVFLMLTGALLLPKDIELLDFLKKRLIRIIFPLIFWSLIYILFSLSLKFSDGGKITSFETIKYIYVSFRDGSAYHLWYIYMIIGIYLFIPIISKWIRNCNEKEILYFLYIWLCTLFLNQPIFSKIKINIDLSYFSGFLGYLILGYYLSLKTFKNQKLIKIITILLIAFGFFLTAIGTYIMSSYKRGLDEVFYGYLTPNVFMVSVGIFIFFKNYTITNAKIARAIGFISKYSYGIYLIHVLILSLLYLIGIKWDSINPILSIPIITVLCLSSSSIIIFIINKMPFGRYISG